MIEIQALDKHSFKVNILEVLVSEPEEVRDQDN